MHPAVNTYQSFGEEYCFFLQGQLVNIDTEDGGTTLLEL